MRWLHSEPQEFPTPVHLAELVKLVVAGSITRDQAREVLIESVETGRAPSQIVAEHGYAQVSDESTLQDEVEAVMAANPRAVEDYRAGKKQALGALMADVKKRAPHANPKVANALLQEMLA